MTNKRIFVKKRNGYNKEELQLRDNLNLEFNLGLDSVELYVIYDVFNIDEETYELAKTSVFSEIVVDEVFEDVELNDGKYFAYEVLPAQYDQRADSAKESIRLLNSKSKATVRSGKLVLFNKQLTDEQLELVESYLVNPIEARKKDLSILDFTLDSTPKPLKDLAGFLEFDKDALLGLKKEFSLAMNIEDLVFIQDYFKKEGRVPTETEIYVLDCYWSDHCRHTTFETVLDEVKIESELFQKEMQDAFDYYLKVRDELDRNDKPITLMDMASIIGKYHVKVLKDENIEVSEEINACSFFTTIENNGEKERWLIQFKNETHNHPSEIEPFGGASTCIGGAIRDPLSGRSYVYQAMRISGSGNVLQKREDTLKHKLPQIDIAKGTAHGNSSYGNQIGLATTFVRELYDDSYVAKHMEVGAVVGAVKDGDYKRETLVDGDIVVMIGGRTGRDGIQGASGSSVEHTNDSLNTMSSQVQKGNAPEERKLQRLFRKPEVTRLVKKCNDFGAGGVCVAIGELSDGIEIHLEKVLTKYQGLNATELATSESQERMAVAIDKKDYDAFVRECEKENIEYAHVANVTNRRRLEMYYNDEKVVDMSADFLETSGVRQKSTVTMKDNTAANP
ncbi:AIR synthase-related protein, partial [Gemella sp.]